MFRKIALATAATAALSAPAFAGSMTPVPADPVPVAPAPIPMDMGGDWTGAYGGLSLGYANIDAGAGVDDDSVIGGAHIGYDYDFGRFVMGGEVEYEALDATVGGVDVDSVTRLKVRAGYDAGRTLVYGVAGGARADSSIGDDEGYVVGAGVEYGLTQNISVGGEYLYHNFDNFAGTGNDIEANTISARVNYRF